MDGNLIGKAAVVTGASRGIGHAAARCLSKLGVNVVLTARTQDAADTAAATVRGAVGFAAHAADKDAARRCVDFTLERFGRLDILVNNAATNAATARSSTNSTMPFAKRLTSMCGRRSCGRLWRRGHG